MKIKKSYCRIFHKSVLKKEYTIVVELDNNIPIGIYAFKRLENFEFDNKIVEGKLSKESKLKYILSGEWKGKEYSINIMRLMGSKEKCYSRDFTRELRNRVPINEIIEDIFVYGYTTPYRRVVGRVLKEFIEEN